MTAADFIREVLDEFKNLGWSAVLYGPEAHLVLPLFGGLILAAGVAVSVWRDL